tara:strand:- start:5513 stop:6313 length:801 start_codon:yes stop_codon:yes gene_type:complete
MKKALNIILILFFNSLLAQETKTFSSYETFEGVKTIQISNNLCVILYPAHFYGVWIKGDKILKNSIKMEFKNSVLKVYATEENALVSNAEIIIYLNHLQELQLSGNVSVQSNQKVITDNFKLYSRDNSTFSFPVECKNFTINSDGESRGSVTVKSETVRVNAKGTSQITLKLNTFSIVAEQTDNTYLSLNGTTKTLSATLDKKAELSAWALKAEDVYINSANSNDIRITAEKRLKINGQGTAKIYVRGKPSQIDTISINKKTKIIY